MLRSMKELQGITINAKDGDIGQIHDLYFEDALWSVRYFVADTGGWLPGRKVLLPPGIIGTPNGFHEHIPVDLTIEQVKNSPDTDLAQPISRQYESQLHDYFHWAPYWLTEVPSAVLPPVQSGSSAEDANHPSPQILPDDHIPALRSARSVLGYHVFARNKDVGHVEDFYVDDKSWKLYYRLIDLRNWLPGGKKVLVGLHWIQQIDALLSKVHISLRACFKS